MSLMVTNVAHLRTFMNELCIVHEHVHIIVCRCVRDRHMYIPIGCRPMRNDTNEGAIRDPESLVDTFYKTDPINNNP